VFGRDRECASLSRFVTSDTPGAILGVVSGRRLQGKSYLLNEFCAATGGLYFAAEEATGRESLRRMGIAIAEFAGVVAPLRFTDWHDAIDTLLGLGRDTQLPVVIDDFPRLARAIPSLPAIIRTALARADSRARLLLCGSDSSFLDQILSSNAPLSGLAGLELVVRPFDYRSAARLWGLDDRALAMRVNAILGGTPAYRRELARDDAPNGPEDFDAWVVRTVLNPTSALFREPRHLLADELGVHHIGTYHAVLSVIADGHATREGVGHYRTMLEDAGLASREPDAFRDNRATFRIAEPLLTFYHAVMWPIWSDWEQTGDTAELWRHNKQRFVTKVRLFCRKCGWVFMID
jgi:hypothetical protein